MANFIDDLGAMLQAAMRANIASFTNAVDSPQGTAAFYFDYSQESGGNQIDGDNVCNINFTGADTVTEVEESAQTVYQFMAKFSMFDVAGAGKSVAVARQGMTNTFANRGRTALETYLTDNGSNWLGKSGRIEWDWTVTPISQLADRDHPEVESIIRVTIDHKVPLA